MTNPTNYAEARAAYEAAKQALRESTRAFEETREDGSCRVYWQYALTRPGREEMAHVTVEAMPGEDPDRIAERIDRWIEEEPESVDALDWQEDEFADPGEAFIEECSHDTLIDPSLITQVDVKISNCIP